MIASVEYRKQTRGRSRSRPDKNFFPATARERPIGKSVVPILAESGIRPEISTRTLDFAGSM